MDPLDKTGHTDILTAMASDYHQASAALKEARQGLIAAVADAKAIGFTTAEIKEITGWSVAQIKNIAAYSVATQAATDQPTETPHDPADATA
jgi:hypothetical protein